MNTAKIIESVERALFSDPILGTRMAKQAARLAILATLDAIREPSEAMMEAGLDYFRTVPGTDDEDQVRGQYQAMIDVLKCEVLGSAT